ncbi:MAG TPA: 3-dehydroquinate synthase [Pyrinomonadaceae bacterium]|nr:3-dehydroquinate synthase [Pyrinomonadaceae bacterium]
MVDGERGGRAKAGVEARSDETRPGSARGARRRGGASGRVAVRLGRGESYSIGVGAGLLEDLGRSAREAVGAGARRVALVSNARVFRLYGERAARGLGGAGFEVARWAVGDGERFKTLKTAEALLRFLASSGFERTDAVVALGGGVVGDLAGFAAAAYLRGVAFVQAPTTLLAQIDSSVGGKTGVNLPEGKNLVGAFHQPRAVVADTSTLSTLPARELTAGWCEALKHGAVGDRRLFERTCAFLRRGAGGGGHDPEERADELARLVAAQCAFKARVVAGDEREDVGRHDARSRKILNFGHTVGHALEAVTGYRRFRHGEAVGHGMLAAAVLSKNLGLLAADELEYLREGVRLAGRLPPASDLDPAEILRATRADKKAAGGRLRWVLLERVGGARITDESEVPARTVLASLRSALGAG